MIPWEQRFDTVVTQAWEAWTNNGAGLDEDAREQTTKSVRDAATNVYVESLDDIEWLNATLTRLEGDATTGPRAAG
jgi:hypothetical protein